MALENSLVVDAHGSEQIVRRPQHTDAIGETLSHTFKIDEPLSSDMAKLLAQLTSVYAKRC